MNSSHLRGTAGTEVWSDEVVFGTQFAFVSLRLYHLQYV